MTPRRDFPSDSNGAADWRPGKLWSLWDMLRFNGASFQRVMVWIQHISTMHERNMEDVSERPTLQEKVYSGDGEFNDRLLHSATKLKQELATIGAPLTGMLVNRLIEDLEDKKLSFEDLGKFATAISSRITDELELVNLFVLDPEAVKYFEPKAPVFGGEVERAFPSGVFEIEEACKCYALKRSTAAVFHLMRLLEIGIRAVARCLAIPDPIKDADRNWGKILGKIKDAIATRAWSDPKDKDFFALSYALLDAVRAAWRNTTMHVDTKYTAEEAEHVLIAVRGFMKTLASRMNEQGQPAA